MQMILILNLLLQKAELTVDKTLEGPYNLVVGLRCSQNGTCSANGNLYRDFQGSHINVTFTANEKELAFIGSCSNLTLQDVSVYGLEVKAYWNNCTVVSSKTGASCSVTEEDGVIEISNLILDLCLPEGGKIEWKINTEVSTNEP
jgi:hypothetical protein